MKNMSLLIGAILALLSSGAIAHFPTLDCQTTNADQLTCVTGYSDGSRATNATVNVNNYDGEQLMVLTSDDEGEVSLAIPEGDFYLVFDPGHEDAAEFDSAEL